MANILASTPVSVPAQNASVYNEWYLTQLIVKADAGKAFTVVQLQRCLTNQDGSISLMPANMDKSTVSFNLDLFKEMGNVPALATAFSTVLEAVEAYASSKKLI